LVARWQALPARHRLVLVALLAGVLAAAAIGSFLRSDARVPLFAAPLHAEQVAEVAERLAEWNVPFAAGADNVKVDARRRNDVLLRLSLAGVPHAHRLGSSESLERIGPLTPQSVLDARAREGLAGDLAAALRGIAGIDDAQVIIAPGRPATFADESSAAPSAGVRVRLVPGARLDRDAIDGIRQFVADSVSGLSATRVAMLDDRGLALEGDRQRAGDDAATLQASLQSALDQAFGAGATIVRVRLDYDRRVREVRDLHRAPIAGQALTSASIDERYSAERKRYTKLHTSEERGSDLHEEKTEIPAGGVGRISVAVVVDEARKLDLAAIRSLSSATLGLVAERDTLNVAAVPFAHASDARGSAWGWLGLAGTLGPIVAWWAIALFAFRYGAAPFARALEIVSRRLALARTSRAVAGYPPAHVRGALRDEPPHTAAAIISALPAATATAVLELYPAEERAAIVRRMARETAPVVPDCESVLRHA
jgi:flagellar biosynthesis/type III secretory pathway M-ring protein FliF/YscJ